jgi:large subunit ribosomal protein L10
MALTKNKKQEIFKKVEDAVESSKSIVFINFHGLAVSDSTAVRRELKSKGVNYLVAKKTITKKVLEKKKIPGDLPALDGELGIIYGEDQIAPAREIYDFQKKFEGKLSILGGIFEGRFQSREEMTTIATIPPLQTLRGMFVNLINSPIQGLVIALNGIAEKKQ